MLKTIWRAVRLFFVRFRIRHKNQHGDINGADTPRNIDGEGDAPVNSTRGEWPETATKGLNGNNAGVMEDRQDGKRQALSNAARNISLLTLELKPYHNRTSTVRFLYVERFGDAYRFMLKLCNGQTVTTVHRGGYTTYKVKLPDNAGTLELKAKGRWLDKKAVAILVFNTETPDITIKEIRFLKGRKSSNKIIIR